MGVVLENPLCKLLVMFISKMPFFTKMKCIVKIISKVHTKKYYSDPALFTSIIFYADVVLL